MYDVNVCNAILPFLHPLSLPPPLSHLLPLSLSPTSSLLPPPAAVVDKNDNPPVFDESTYLFSVEENTEVVMSLAVRAQDADAGANGEVQYEIVSGNELGTFIISK